MVYKLSCQLPSFGDASAPNNLPVAEGSSAPAPQHTFRDEVKPAPKKHLAAPPTAHAQLLLPPATGVGPGTRLRDANSTDMTPARVTIAPPGERLRLRRDGHPYFVCGAGGWTPADVDAVARVGANSFRTWRADVDAKEILDRAQQNGMTVALGLNIVAESDSPGFYADKHAMSAQEQKVAALVQAYRNHPALLMWGVGNELENGYSGKVPERVWRQWGEMVRLVKKLDPDHPTMIAAAEISQEKINLIKKYMPELDILGVNAYAGAPTVGRRLKEFGWDKPYLLSEFGHVGGWDAKTTPWKAPLEPTSNEKETAYRRGFEEGALAHPGAAVGGYAFFYHYPHWEGTNTWFPLVDKRGNTTNPVDSLHEMWTGHAPTNKAPRISELQFDGREQYVSAGQALSARFAATDPDGDPLKPHWEVRVDDPGYGDGSPIDHKDILSSLTPHSDDGTGLTLRAPKDPGPYRLYLRVTDGHGHAATASAPFFVRGAAQAR